MTEEAKRAVTVHSLFVLLTAPVLMAMFGLIGDGFEFAGLALSLLVSALVTRAAESD